MRQKIVLLGIVAIMLGCFQSQAQTSYKTGLGLGFDFGEGQSLVGPVVKHFFAPRHALQAEVMFGDNVALLTAFYEYNREIPNVPGFKWYAGGGASVGIYKNFSSLFLRPIGGVDYKFPNIPLDLSLDWRPSVLVTDDHHDNNDYYYRYPDTTPGRFGTSVRYTF